MRLRLFILALCFATLIIPGGQAFETGKELSLPILIKAGEPEDKIQADGLTALLHKIRVDESLPCVDLYYFSRAVFTGGNEDALNSFVPIIASETERRSASGHDSSSLESLYIFEIYLDMHEYYVSAKDLASAQSLYPVIETNARELMSRFPSVMTEDDEFIAYTGALLQKFVGICHEADDNDIALAQTFSDMIYNYIIGNADLSTGIPFWFHADKTVTLSRQASILNSLFMYNEYSDIVLPFSPEQAESALSACVIHSEIKEKLGQYFQYSYWVFRPDDGRTDIMADFDTLMCTSNASNAIGRKSLGKDILRDIMRRNDTYTTKELYAISLSIWVEEKAR